MLFNCEGCGFCCSGQAFSEPTAFLLPKEGKYFNQYGWVDYQELPYSKETIPYLKVWDNRCILMHKGRCTHYDKRPLCCRIYPIGLIGDDIIIMSECRSAKFFIKKFIAGDKEVVQHIKWVKEQFESMPEKYRNLYRLESGFTKILFSFGKIK